MLKKVTIMLWLKHYAQNYGGLMYLAVAVGTFEFSLIMDVIVEWESVSYQLHYHAIG